MDALWRAESYSYPYKTTMQKDWWRVVEISNGKRQRVVASHLAKADALRIEADHNGPLERVKTYPTKRNK